MDRRAKAAIYISLLVAFLLIASFVIAARAPKPSKACDDGADNDGDGYIDLNDPGCENKRDNSELNPAIECDDGADNDGDSAVDYNDNGCTGPTDDDETNCGDSVCEGGEDCVLCITDCGPCSSCSDTDGGENEAIQGTVSGYTYGEPYEYTDYCTGTVLEEYYCSGYWPFSYQVDCAATNTTTTDCIDGACV